MVHFLRIMEVNQEMAFPDVKVQHLLKAEGRGGVLWITVS